MKKLLAVLVLGVSMISCSAPDAPQETVQEPSKENTTEVITSGPLYWMGSNVTHFNTPDFLFNMIPNTTGTGYYIEVQKKVNGVFIYDSKALTSDTQCVVTRAFTGSLNDVTWTFISKAPGIPDKKFKVRKYGGGGPQPYWIDRIY
jgi:hypothetical protein